MKYNGHVLCLVDTHVLGLGSSFLEHWVHTGFWDGDVCVRAGTFVQDASGERSGVSSCPLPRKVFRL